MDDVYYGDANADITVPEIINIYRYKTGRYSIGLPLVTGAILAGQKPPVTDIIWKLGENLGILFQIKDDELAIFGDEKNTGKPVGNDIAKNKKTLFRKFLFDNASDMQQRKLSGIFGSKIINGQDIAYVKTISDELGIRQKIAEYEIPMFKQVETGLNSLKLPDAKRQLLLDFAGFTTGRNK
jgi:geranylgeranyl diphosphate synthase, type I